jgi:integrase
MARAVKKLNPRQVATLQKRGRNSDGGGLYLVVGPGASRRWAFIFRWHGKLKEMGLGSLTSVSLSDARDKAAEARRVLAGGSNPIEVRRVQAVEQAIGTTFGVFADELVKGLAHGFRNEKHKAQWAMTLTKYAAPLRAMKLNDIATTHVLGVLQPLWRSKPETASRLRGRIERVLDAAKARGLRNGENPARWRGHLEALLPKRQRLTRGHHAAMPYRDVPAFIARLRAAESISGLALEFAVLTATRSGEVLGARWQEIDLNSKLWTIPTARMKGGREHRVPLTPRAVAILKASERISTGEFVFPGQRPGKPLCVTALAKVLRRLGLKDVTVHGFRSSFRDWAGNETSVPREVAEAALAHSVGDMTERAYRRDDALEKRRKLMSAWANFVEPKAASNVVTIVRTFSASEGSH